MKVNGCKARNFLLHEKKYRIVIEVIIIICTLRSLFEFGVSVVICHI